MDPQTLQTLERIITDAIKEHASGSVPFAWVAIIVGGLVSAIGATWAWGLRKANASNEELKRWAEKVEELANSQRNRDDERDDKARERYVTVIERLETRQQEEVARWRARLERMEASRDEAQSALSALLRENISVLNDRLADSANAEREVAEFLEVIIPKLERLEELKQSGLDRS